MSIVIRDPRKCLEFGFLVLAFVQRKLRGITPHDTIIKMTISNNIGIIIFFVSRG